MFLQKNSYKKYIFFFCGFGYALLYRWIAKLTTFEYSCCGSCWCCNSSSSSSSSSSPDLIVAARHTQGAQLQVVDGDPTGTERPPPAALTVGSAQSLTQEDWNIRDPS